MNLNLLTFLLVSGLSFHALGQKTSGHGKNWGGGQSASTAPQAAPAAPFRSAPHSMSIPSAPQPSRSYSAPERTYTPSQTYRSAPVTKQADIAPTPAPQHETTQRFSETRRPERTITPAVTQTKSVVQPARSDTPPPSTFQSAPERAARTPSTRDHEWGREAPDVAKTPTTRSQPATTRGETTPPVTIRFPSGRDEQERVSRTPSTRNQSGHEVPDVKTVAPKTTRPSTPEATEQRIAAPTREPRTFRQEEPGKVKITPSRTERSVTERSASPFSFSDRSHSSRERFEVGSRTPATKTGPLNQAQLQAASLRSPQRTDSHTFGDDRAKTAYTSNLQHSPRYPKPIEDRRTPYYSHHYPSHSRHHDYRPMTCYSGREAFWTAFGFTLGASMFAPVYVAPFGYSHVSYSTAWHGGSVTVSVGGPAYSSYHPYYRPYYCNTGYIHDGWYHSSAYYGGWRCNWYGGFSYMFNPTPIYRTYYLYEEPQTIVIEQPAPQVVYVNQPAPQVVYVNQPAQQVVEQVQQTPAIPASETPQLQDALPSVAAEAQTAQAQENAHCFCACKCNGRVPCICEYACGSEFAYSPDDYTLKGFASYSESLNAELIWSSYAGLDRPEATDIVAGAAD